MNVSQVAGAPDNTSLALSQMSFTLMVIGNLVRYVKLIVYDRL